MLGSFWWLCVIAAIRCPIEHESGLTFDSGVCADNHRWLPFNAENIIQKVLISCTNRNRFVQMHIWFDIHRETYTKKIIMHFFVIQHAIKLMSSQTHTHQIIRMEKKVITFQKVMWCCRWFGRLLDWLWLRGMAHLVCVRIVPIRW